MIIASAIASSTDTPIDSLVSCVELERLRQSPELLSDLRDYVVGRLSLADLLARLRSPTAPGDYSEVPRRLKKG